MNISLFRRGAVLAGTALLIAGLSFGQGTGSTADDACAIDPASPFGNSESLTRFVTLEATLDSSSENPPPPSASGSGTAHITIRLDRMNATTGATSATVVAMFNVRTVDGESLTAAHIHEGPIGMNGSVVIPLNPSSAVQTTADEDQTIRVQIEITDQASLDALADIISNPGDYYANVHSASAPSGIVRGQLRRTSSDQGQCTQQSLTELTSQVAMLRTTLTAASAALTTASTDLAQIKTSVAAIRQVTDNLDGDGGSNGGNDGGNNGGNNGADPDLTQLTNRLNQIMRLIVLGASNDGLISASERDQLLNSIPVQE